MEDFVEFLLFELYIYYLYSQYYKQTPFLITVIEIEFNFAIEVYVHVVYNLKTKSKIFKNYFLHFIIFDFNICSKDIPISNKLTFNRVKPV